MKLSGIFSAFRSLSPFSGTHAPRQTEGPQQSKKTDAVPEDGRKNLMPAVHAKKTEKGLRARLPANSLPKAGESKHLGQNPVGNMLSSASPGRRLGEQIREASKPKAGTLDASNEINKETSRASQQNLRLVKSAIMMRMESLPKAKGKRDQLDAALVRYEAASHLTGAQALDAFKTLHDDLVNREKLLKVKSSILTMMELMNIAPSDRKAAIARYENLEAEHKPDAEALKDFRKLLDGLITGKLEPVSSPNQKVGENLRPTNGKLEPVSSPNPNQKTGENLQSIKRSIVDYMNSLPSDLEGREELDTAIAHYKNLHKLHRSRPNDATALNAYKELHDDLVNGKYKPDLPQHTIPWWAKEDKREEARLLAIIDREIGYDDDYEKATRERDDASAELKELRGRYRRSS